MSKILSAVALAATISLRQPGSPQPGSIDSIAAAGDPPAESTLSTVQAASIRSFTDVAGAKLVWVRAKDHFLLAGETITQDTIVQVREDVSKELLRMDRVTLVSDAELKAAQTENQ